VRGPARGETAVGLDPLIKRKKKKKKKSPRAQTGGGLKWGRGTVPPHPMGGGPSTREERDAKNSPWTESNYRGKTTSLLEKQKRKGTQLPYTWGRAEEEWLPDGKGKNRRKGWGTAERPVKRS